MDTDHDDKLRSFEFFEVIECGHFFPTSRELNAMNGSPRVYRTPSLSQQSLQPSVPALAIGFGGLTCLFSVLLALGLRMAGKAEFGRADRERRETYTAMPYSKNSALEEYTLSTSASSNSSGRMIISL
uniref:Uncharacterized protein n=1 Tax=Alexandrium andersonii TaxID=327968 RepID=A0A7S2GKS4_9DINO